MALVVEALPTASTFFSFVIPAEEPVTPEQLCCAIRETTTVACDQLDDKIALQLLVDSTTGDCCLFPASCCQLLVRECLQVTPDRAANLPAPVGNGTITSNPLTWQITSITITQTPTSTPIELVTTIASRTVDPTTLLPVFPPFAVARNGLVTEFVDSLNSMFVELGVDCLFQAANGPQVLPAPFAAGGLQQQGAVAIIGPAFVYDWVVTQNTPVQIGGGNSTTLLWAKNGNNTGYYDCPDAANVYPLVGPVFSVFSGLSGVTNCVVPVSKSIENRSIATRSIDQVRWRSETDPIMRARSEKINLPSTPLEAEHYPLMTFMNASQLLKDRVSLVRRAMEVAFELEHNDPFLKLWLFGSQVKGTSGSGSPDIDIAFYHPQMGHPGPLLGTAEKERIATVLRLLKFKVDLQFTTNQEFGLPIPILE